MKWESQWGTSHYPLYCIARNLPEIECCLVGKQDIYNSTTLYT